MRKNAKAGEALKFVKWASQQETDECIIWPYGKTGAGYGDVSVDGKSVKVHRLSLAMSQGVEPPKELFCLHQPEVCHNPSCVNPRHLRWGTPSENQMDKFRDGTDSRGEKCYKSKLTEKQVRKIKVMNDVRRKCLASIYNVSDATIKDIRGGRSWSHV